MKLSFSFNIASKNLCKCNSNSNSEAHGLVPFSSVALDPSWDSENRPVAAVSKPFHYFISFCVYEIWRNVYGALLRALPWDIRGEGKENGFT